MMAVVGIIRNSHVPSPLPPPLALRPVSPAAPSAKRWYENAISGRLRGPWRGRAGLWAVACVLTQVFPKAWASSGSTKEWKQRGPLPSWTDPSRRTRRIQSQSSSPIILATIIKQYRHWRRTWRHRRRGGSQDRSIIRPAGSGEWTLRVGWIKQI